MNTEQLMQALRQLDVANDDHWTSAGLPLMEVVEKLSGLNPTRKELEELAPGFSRTNPNLPAATEPSLANGKGDNDNAGEDQKNTANPTSEKATGNEKEGSDTTEVSTLSEKEEAQVKVTDARKAVDVANKHLKSVVAELDVILTKEGASGNQVTFADNVKAYQASQARTLQSSVARRKRIAEAVAAAELES